MNFTRFAVISLLVCLAGCGGSIVPPERRAVRVGEADRLIEAVDRNTAALKDIAAALRQQRGEPAKPVVPEMVPYTEAELACLDATNAALEEAGLSWANRLSEADQYGSRAGEVLRELANDLYNRQIEQIMNMHDMCVAAYEAQNGISR